MLANKNIDVQIDFTRQDILTWAKQSVDGVLNFTVMFQLLHKLTDEKLEDITVIVGKDHGVVIDAMKELDRAYKKLVELKVGQ